MHPRGLFKQKNMARNMSETLVQSHDWISTILRAMMFNSELIDTYIEDECNLN